MNRHKRYQVRIKQMQNDRRAVEMKREGGSACPRCRGKLRRRTGQQGGSDRLQCNACGYMETAQ